MIKQTAGLSIIAILLLTLALGACIAPAGAPLLQADPQMTDDASANQSIAEALGQGEGDAETDSSDPDKALAQADQAGDGAAASTPELIEQAYAAGAINAEERALYLTYAVYEYDSLPPAYQSGAPWRGTMIVRELDEFLNAPAFCEMSPEIQSELERLLGEAACTSS